MAHGVDQTWLSIFLQKKFYKIKKIPVFNYGNHTRDFTYIDNIVDNIIILVKKKYPKKIEILIVINQKTI